MKKHTLSILILASSLFFPSIAMSDYPTTIDKNSFKLFWDTFDLTDYDTPPDASLDLGYYVSWKDWYGKYYRTPFHRSLAIAYPKNNIWSADFSGFCYIPGWNNRNEADVAALDCCKEFKEKSHTCTILFRNNDILDKNYLTALNPKMPANAYESGTSWKCNTGYTKTGVRCLQNEINVEVIKSSLPNCPESGVWNNCFGTHTWDDGEKYIGEWKNDEYFGQGTSLYSGENAGDKYAGEWKSSEFNGQGTYTFADGKINAGEWQNHLMNGLGIVIYPDGTKKEGIFKEDVFQSSKKYVPKNAYSTGANWACNTGYKKSGFVCLNEKPSVIPANAYAFDSSWKCNTGYTKTGSSCQIIPANATSTNSGWKCNTGFTKNGDSCNKIEEASDYLEELLKLKVLLDSGVIDKDEFDKLKKKIIDNV